MDTEKSDQNNNSTKITVFGLMNKWYNLYFNMLREDLTYFVNEHGLANDDIIDSLQDAFVYFLDQPSVFMINPYESIQNRAILNLYTKLDFNQKQIYCTSKKLENYTFKEKLYSEDIDLEELLSDDFVSIDDLQKIVQISDSFEFKYEGIVAKINSNHDFIKNNLINLKENDDYLIRN